MYITWCVLKYHQQRLHDHFFISIISDSSWEKFLYFEGQMCDFILCALGQLFLYSNWIHRHYFNIESWIILVNEAYNCFTPFSRVYLTALTWVCKWDKWHKMCCFSVSRWESCLHWSRALSCFECGSVTNMWKAQLWGLGVLGELEWGEEGAVWF